MKLILLICFVLAAREINAYVAEVTDILKLTEKMNRYVTDCIGENGEGFEISTDGVTEMFTDEENKDKLLMEKVTRCFFHKAGILEPDGKLNTDAAMAILTLIGVEKNDAEELLQKCTSITGFDAKDTAYAIFKCFHGAVRS